MHTQKQPPLILILLLIAFFIPMGAFGAGNGAHAVNEPWLTEECRSCHDDHTNLPLKAGNPDNHHVLYGTEILHPTAPNSAADDDGLYDCLTCHIVRMTELGTIDVSPERDCFTCHELQTVANRKEGNRHHDTETSIGGQCDICHCRMPEPHRDFRYCSSARPNGM